jgi:hypothetical protein
MPKELKRANFGRLKHPRRRLRQLLALRHLSVKIAGAALGVSSERARQLFGVYGIKRAAFAKSAKRAKLAGLIAAA